MAKRIKIKTHENHYVHFDTGVNNYTLCGLETGGDETLGISIPKTVKRTVNCPQCIDIVKFCQDIQKNEFEQI